MLYAFEGEVVTCESGHPYAKFRRDIRVYDETDPAALQFANGVTPENGAPFAACQCGAEALRVGRLGIIAFIAGQWREGMA